MLFENSEYLAEGSAFEVLERLGSVLSRYVELHQRLDGLAPVH